MQYPPPPPARLSQPAPEREGASTKSSQGGVGRGRTSNIQPPPPPPPKRSAAALAAEEAEHRLVPTAPTGEPSQQATSVTPPVPPASRTKAKRSRTQPPRPVRDEVRAKEKWAQVADLEGRVRTFKTLRCWPCEIFSNWQGIIPRSTGLSTTSGTLSSATKCAAPSGSRCPFLQLAIGYLPLESRSSGSTGVVFPHRQPSDCRRPG